MQALHSVCGLVFKSGNNSPSWGNDPREWRGQWGREGEYPGGGEGEDPGGGGRREEGVHVYKKKNGEWRGQWRRERKREKIGKMNSLNGGEANREWERWKDRKD